jgi:hypothetical protein
VPTGRVKAGKARVAGITTVEIKMRLDFMVLDRDLKSRSQALGVALAEWDRCCGRRVLLDDSPSASEGSASDPPRVVHPTDSQREGVSRDG